MFRSFVYLNKDKMYSYLRLIDEKYMSQMVEKSTEKRTGANLGIVSFGVSAEMETKEQRSFLMDPSRDYDVFEKALEKLDGSEFFDLSLNPDYDIKSVPQMSIIRLYGTLNIPEQFDMYSVAPKLMDYITKKSSGDMSRVN